MIGGVQQPVGRQRIAVQFNLRGLIILLALVVTSLLPLQLEAQGRTFTFDTIAVQGNQRIESATVQNTLGIQAGQAVTAGEINDALQRLQQSGVFETVEIDPRGNTLVVTVQEFPTVNRVSFEGNRRISDDVLGELIESSSRRVFSPAQAEADSAAIAAAYAQQGRIAATVTPRIIRRDDNRVDLIYEIAEGTTIEVERITIVGNEAYSERRLRRVLATKQANFLRTFIGQDTLIEDRIEVDQQLLSDFYASRGYIDFRILSTNVALSRERDGFFIVFNVQEGQQFKFGNISTRSEINGVDGVAYQEALRVRPGVVYSPTLIEESVARQERLAIQQGLDFLRVRPEVTRNAETQTLDVVFVLEQGPRLFIERIDIEGNTTTLDRVVRQQFRVVEGDPLNPREIANSADRIRALGFFEDVLVDTREGTSPDQRIVDVDVVEAPTGSLNLGGSFSVTDGFGIAIGLQESNFLGRGQRLALNVQTAQESEAYSIGFSEPYLLGRDLRFDFDIGVQGRTSSFVSYNTSRDFITPSLTFPVGENARLRTNLFYNAREMQERNGVNPGVVVAREIAFGKRTDVGLGLRYTYDSRLTGLNPNAGVLVEVGADFSGLGGDNTYIKPEARVIAQSRVLNEEVTLRASFETGYLLWQSNTPTRSVDRFFTTPSRLRGFEPGGIGPREISNGVNEPLGGNVFTVARLEAEFPLPIPEEIGMRGGVFYDVGNLWDLKNANLSGANVVGEGGSLRHVVGVSILWTTPIGPLRFNFARPLIKEDFDRSQAFDLTVQAQF